MSSVFEGCLDGGGGRILVYSLYFAAVKGRRGEMSESSL